MRRFVIMTAVLSVTTGCHRGTVGWEPSLVSQVPDSALVRFTSEQGGPSVTGRALDWHSRMPRVVTDVGDTLVVPPQARLSLRLPGKVRHAGMGAIIGGVVGGFATLVRCSDQTVCEQGDPTGFVAAGVGALIGALIRTDHWIRIQWDAK